MAHTWKVTRKKLVAARTLNFAARAFRAGWATPTPPPPLDPLTVESILVLELWNIGDVVLATPFLAELRRLFPRARVTLLGKAHARELLAGSGLVDEVIVFDFPWTSAAGKYHPQRYRLRDMRALVRELRRRNFDLSFDCRMDARANVVAYLARARRRVGYAFGGAEPLLTDAVPVTSRAEHKSADWLRLLAPFGGSLDAPQPRLAVSDEERSAAREYLRARGVFPGDVVVGLHAGGSRTEKRWPLDRFGAVAEHVIQSGARVLWFVDPAGYGSGVGARPGVIPVRPTMRELMALLEQCSLLVCNDSGPMHVAAALGVPVVAVFGSGVADWFAPMGGGHRVITRADMPCRPCYDACVFGEPFCLTRIAEADVLTAVDAALSSKVPA